MRRSQLGRTAVLSLILGILYVVLARLGLSFATVGRSVTLVWPPTGLSLAVLFLFGRGLWPGVLAGALVVNALTPGVPLHSACVMAIGNTLEAVVGASLLRRSAFHPTLRRTRDVIKLIGLAALVSTAISATVGTLGLWLGGVIPRSALFEAFRVWWIGDLIGDLIVAPLILVWLSRDPDQAAPPIMEGLALLIVLVTMSALVFSHPVVFLFAAQPYAVFPLLIWAALRFGPRGSVSANFVISAVSIWATLGAQGPFGGQSLSDSLLLLQAFMAIAAVTSLTLGATAAERADALQARENFISIASHEIRTPLTSLQLQVPRLRRLWESGPEAAPRAEPTRADPTLNIIERQIARLSALAEVLLDLTRLRTGELTLHPEDVDLMEILRDATAPHRTAALDAQSTVEIKGEGPIVGHWDRLRLGQVVSNLLGNALKYGAGKPVLITAAADAAWATIDVEDQGPGIPRRDQQRIFQRFERTATNRSLPGLGLGLHIAREITEAHGGKVRVSSTPGRGATFTVSLPLRPRYRRHRPPRR